VVPTVVSATTIVGIWTEKQVIIAADSRQTMMLGTAVVGSRPACKVYEVRNLIFALAGLTESDGVSIVEDMRSSVELKDQATGVKLPEASLVVAVVLQLPNAPG
jgi:20S proteasome alpha/beta subunit